MRLGFKILFVFFFCFFSNLSFSEVKYQKDFAFFCKSYAKDLEKAVFLYKSFLNNSDITIPFYFVVPKEEILLFKNRFSKIKKENSNYIEPTFISQDYILKKCNVYHRIEEGLKKFQKGWIIQQIVKMCISQSFIAKDYVTIDSDVYFVKKITKDNFYDSNGQLKLVGKKIGNVAKAIKYFNLKNSACEDEHRYETASFARYIFRPEINTNNEENLVFYDFVSHYALWDSNILIEMKNYVKRTMDFDFYDLIKLNPWEMQWYGQFIQSKHPERMSLMDRNFILTLGYNNEESKNSRCLPENGYSQNYLVANQSEIGYKMPDTLYCKVRNRLNYINLLFSRFINYYLV